MFNIYNEGEKMMTVNPNDDDNVRDRQTATSRNGNLPCLVLTFFSVFISLLNYEYCIVVGSVGCFCCCCCEYKFVPIVPSRCYKVRLF